MYANEIYLTQYSAELFSVSIALRPMQILMDCHSGDHRISYDRRKLAFQHAGYL